ncbi:MAG: hypothetical protein H0X69_15900, partial [Gemmatimonadales bacterium]|nr:hypothetical protein [Gemmatimonadales bacterium]
MSPVIDTGRTSWQNRHETYTQSLRGVLQAVNEPPHAGDPLQRYNTMTGTLQALIGRALQEGVRLRAFGGGWSFSGAPSTDGYLLDTSPLNLWFRIRDRSIHPGPGPARRALLSPVRQLHRGPQPQPSGGAAVAAHHRREQRAEHR